MCRAERRTRWAEGGVGYNTMFGGGTFDGVEHPDRVVSAGGYDSAAAGAYQFMPKTWRMITKKYNIPSQMTPENQDRAALGLMLDRGMNPKQGWSDEAAFKLAPEWASFPTRSGRSYYDQPVKKLDKMKKLYADLLQQERNRDQQQGMI